MSCSVYFAPAGAEAAIASSGRVIVCGCPSSVTGIGVAWLPTTTPRFSSTSCAKTWVPTPVPE